MGWGGGGGGGGEGECRGGGGWGGEVGGVWSGGWEVLGESIVSGFHSYQKHHSQRQEFMVEMWEAFRTGPAAAACSVSAGYIHF